MTGRVERTKDITKYFLSRAALGADWLVDNQATDGSIHKSTGIGAMFKAVYALYNTGRIGAATRLLDFLDRKAMTEPGEFHLPGEGEKEALEFGYRNSFILLGAWKMGRFDIASREAINSYVKKYQHECGGFFGGAAPDSGEGVIDPCNTALGGWVCLYSGQFSRALKAGDFLIELWRKQPNPQDKLYFVYDTTRGDVVNEFPSDETICYSIDTRMTKGWFYEPGSACGFLTELAQASGHSKYLKYAREYADFCLRLNARSLSWIQHCKSGWGVAQLYRVTRDKRYEDYAEKVAETLITNQHRDGHWDRFLFPLKNNGSGYYLSAPEVTAEFTFELTEIVKGVDSPT